MKWIDDGNVCLQCHGPKPPPPKKDQQVDDTDQPSTSTGEGDVFGDYKEPTPWEVVCNVYI